MFLFTRLINLLQMLLNCATKLFENSIRRHFPLAVSNSRYFLTNSSNNDIIRKQGSKTIWDFSKIDSTQGKIDCIIIQNNITINLPWLTKTLHHTDNIILADGGANMFYQTGLGDHAKVRAIIGDLDSLKSSVRQFYQGYGVPIKKQEDQNKNDFEKTVEWAISKGWKHILCFGAFGGRMDHTLATMSNTQKMARKYPQLQIVLLGRHNMMCHLRQNVHHVIIPSQDISKPGCGVVTFNQIDNIQTKGFKWNMGKQHAFKKIKWGQFISTSNQMVEDKVQIETIGNSHHLYFVATFLKQ